MKRITILMAIAAIFGFLNVNAQYDVNYDESKVGPYTLPDPLLFADGTKVTPENWQQRRHEILEIFQSEMYGRIPPKMDFTLEKLEEGETLAGFGHRRQYRMWFRDDKTGPFIDWLIVTPRQVKGKAPVIMTLNYAGNHTLLTDEEVVINDSRNVPKNQFGTLLERGCYANPNQRTYYPLSMILARGYAFVTASYNDISPDPDPATEEEQDIYAYQRCFDLWPARDPSRTDNTTALAAWAWGLMRGMDMVERDSLLDAKHMILTGSSRLGKAGLLAAAYDERFPLVVPNQTGGGGVPLAKRNYGESITTEMQMFTHWYCKAYKKYAGHEDIMPFDQHMLLACVAPRGLLVEGFDTPWFDTKGEFLSIQAASPVWEMLGKKGLPQVSWPDDYDTSAIGETIGYVRRDLEHGHSAIDWTWMMDFADHLFGFK